MLLTGDDDEVTLMDNCLSGGMREALAGTLNADDRDAYLNLTSDSPNFSSAPQ